MADDPENPYTQLVTEEPNPVGKLDKFSSKEIYENRCMKTLKTAIVFVFIIGILMMPWASVSDNLIYRFNHAKMQNVSMKSETLKPDTSSSPVNQTRLAFIRQMTKESWDAYYGLAFGKDAFCPISQKSYQPPIYIAANPNWIYQTSYHFDSGRTILAAMTTLHLMNFTEEFNNGRDWIENNLFPTKEIISSSTDDVIKQYIGSLVSLHAITGDKMFKNLANRLFLSPSIQQIPYEGQMTMLELFSVGWDKLVDDYKNEPKLPLKFSLKDCAKSFLQAPAYPTSLSEPYFECIINASLFSPGNNPLLTQINDPSQLMQFPYGCNSGATYGLVAYVLQLAVNRSIYDESKFKPEFMQNQAKLYLELAETATETCHLVSRLHDSGLVHENYSGANMCLNDFYSDSNSNCDLSLDEYPNYYSLTPGLAESYFILYQMTKNPKYQEFAWDLATAIYSNTRIDGKIGGYVGLLDVFQKDLKNDFQEPVFLSGTLKYLYLTMASDDLFPFDKWVFNEVGHPLPVIDFLIF